MNKSEDFLSKRLKSKTYWLGVLVIFVGFAQANFPMIANYLGEYQGAVNFVIGFLVLFLRELTKTPISEK